MFPTVIMVLGYIQFSVLVLLLALFAYVMLRRLPRTVRITSTIVRTFNWPVVIEKQGRWGTFKDIVRFFFSEWFAPGEYEELKVLGQRISWEGKYLGPVQPPVVG